VVTKLELLLARRPGAPADGLAGALDEEVARLGTELPAGCGLQMSTRLADDPIVNTPHGREVADGPSFDAALSIGGTGVDHADLAEAVADLGDRLDELVALDRCAALAGAVHVFVRGTGPILGIMAFRRRPDLTHDEFIDYWLNHHRHLVLGTAPSDGYRQFHADPEASARAAAAAGVGLADFDGTAEARHQDTATFSTFIAQSEVSELALGDERNFVDHRRTALGLYDIRTESPPLADAPTGD
jgi:hypothetical protein